MNKPIEGSLHIDTETLQEVVTTITRRKIKVQSLWRGKKSGDWYLENHTAKSKKEAFKKVSQEEAKAFLEKIDAKQEIKQYFSLPSQGPDRGKARVR